MLEQIRERIAQIEKSIQELVQNHAVLTGHLNEARSFLEMASKAGDEVLPENPVSDVLDVIEDVVDIVDPE